MDLEYFMRPSRWVFYAHSLFWMGFLVARMRALTSDSSGGRGANQAAQHTDEAVHARHATALVRTHVAVIIGLYPALWITTTNTPTAPSLARGVTAIALITVGAVSAGWAISVFRSYRLRATLEIGHELCEDGPFRHVRHPIYLSFGLLGLGSAIWGNTPILWGIAALLWVVADLRARSEETLLTDTFGERYRAYIGLTKRLLPWVY